MMTKLQFTMDSSKFSEFLYFWRAVIVLLTTIACAAPAFSQSDVGNTFSRDRRILSVEELRVQTEVTFSLYSLTQQKIAEMSDSDPRLRELYIQGMGTPPPRTSTYVTLIDNDIFRRPSSLKILSNILQDTGRPDGINDLFNWISVHPAYPGTLPILDEAVTMFHSGKLPTAVAAWLPEVIAAVGGPQHASVFAELERIGKISSDSIRLSQTRFEKRLANEAVLRSPRSIPRSQSTVSEASQKDAPSKWEKLHASIKRLRGFLILSSVVIVGLLAISFVLFRSRNSL